jgi:hypothetical protein
MVPLSWCLSATGIRFLGVLFPPRDSASLTVGLPPRQGAMDLTGLPRSTRMRNDRVGCQLYPGSSGVHATIGQCSVAACRFSTARSLSSPPARPDSGSCRNEASPLVHSGSPFRSSPHLWHPVGAGTLGLPPGLRTRPLPATHARGGDRSRTLTEVTSSTSSRTSNRRTTQGVRPRVALIGGRRGRSPERRQALLRPRWKP